MLVYGHDQELAEWLGWRLGIKFAQPYICIGVVRGETLVAACLYNNYQPPNIEITFATTTPRWASREVIRQILGYPFCQLGCLRISALVHAGNEPTRSFLCRLGFRQEGFHPSLYADDDGVSYGFLKRDAQKWLEGFHEQGQPERSAADQSAADSRGADHE